MTPGSNDARFRGAAGPIWRNSSQSGSVKEKMDARPTHHTRYAAGVIGGLANLRKLAPPLKYRRSSQDLVAVVAIRSSPLWPPLGSSAASDIIMSAMLYHLRSRYDLVIMSPPDMLKYGTTNCVLSTACERTDKDSSGRMKD